MSSDQRSSTEGREAAGYGRLRVAFLGGGIDSAVGRVHQIAIEMDHRYELVAGCFSRNQEANLATARAYGVSETRTYQSLSELLKHESEQIDAIVILTPTDQHKEQVEICLRAGLPVICEKALVSSSADTIELRDTLSEMRGFLAVTYNYTGYPMLRELRQLTQQGQFGEVEQIHLEMPQEGFARLGEDGNPVVPQDWRLHDSRVPTISLDLGIHLHLMNRFLSGETPLELVAMSTTFGNFNQIVDNVMCSARYTNDMTSSIWYSKTALGYRNGLKVRLFGRAGSAEWYQETPERLFLADHHGRKQMIDRASPEATVSNLPRYTRFKAGHPAGFIEAFANYYHDVADILSAHINGETVSANPYVFGIEEALEGIRMLEAIADSSAKKCWVNLK